MRGVWGNAGHARDPGSPEDAQPISSEFEVDGVVDDAFKTKVLDGLARDLSRRQKVACVVVVCFSDVPADCLVNVLNTNLSIKDVRANVLKNAINGILFLISVRIS